MDEVYRLHGLPEYIISDRDRVFTSAVWRELFKLTDTQLLMSSSYHPQSDGQTERLNQCLETSCVVCVHSCPHQWHQWLSVAEYWYNTTHHSALGFSPFEVLYGHHPSHFEISNAVTAHAVDLDQWLTERRLLEDVVRHHLHRAQQRMKHYADKNRSERVFAVGDMVYLKLQPYIQSSVAPRANQKLIFRFYGLFKILERVEAMAYRLELPPHCHIHPVVHVSQLKLHVPPFVDLEPDITDVPMDFDDTVSPLQFQATRVIQRGASTIAQVHVRWFGCSPTLLTWEEVYDLRRRFPDNLGTSWIQRRRECQDTEEGQGAVERS